jgi:hypothetical protein
MSKSASPNADAIAKDLAAALQGKLDQPKIDAAVVTLKSPTQVYPANATFLSFIFYFRVVVNIDGGKSFGGNAGGIAPPTGGSTAGNVFTDDLDRLYRDTTSFSFISGVVYLGVQFFDANSNLLGHYDGGGAGVPATGGGSGSWS